MWEHLSVDFSIPLCDGAGGLSLGQVVTSIGATNGEFGLPQVGCACVGNCVMGTPHPIAPPPTRTIPIGRKRNYVSNVGSQLGEEERLKRN